MGNSFGVSTDNTTTTIDVYYSDTSVHCGVAGKLIKMTWPHANVNLMPHSFALPIPTARLTTSATTTTTTTTMYIAEHMPHNYIVGDGYWICNRVDGGIANLSPAVQSRLLCNNSSESLITLVWFTLHSRSSVAAPTSHSTPPLPAPPTLLGVWLKKKEESGAQKETEAASKIDKNDDDKQDPEWLTWMLDNAPDVFGVDIDSRRAETFLQGALKDFPEFERRLSFGSAQKMADEQQRLWDAESDRENETFDRVLRSEKDGEIVTDSGERVSCKIVHVDSYADVNFVRQHFYKVKTTDREDDEFRVSPDVLLVFHITDTFYCITRSESGTRVMSRLATALQTKSAWTSLMAPLCIFTQVSPF